MKILRKRVGSLNVQDYNKTKIINDSIFLNDKIIFNYLPIKNLNFFKLKLDKSNLGETKYWIFLDLNLNILFKEISDGKIITNRELIFDMLISSLNRLKISNNTDQSINLNIDKIENIIKNDDFKMDNFYCFENQ